MCEIWTQQREAVSSIYTDMKPDKVVIDDLIDNYFDYKAQIGVARSFENWTFEPRCV